MFMHYKNRHLAYFLLYLSFLKMLMEIFKMKMDSILS